MSKKSEIKRIKEIAMGQISSETSNNYKKIDEAEVDSIIQDSGQVYLGGPTPVKLTRHKIKMKSAFKDVIDEEFLPNGGQVFDNSLLDPDSTVVTKQPYATPSYIEEIEMTQPDPGVWPSLVNPLLDVVKSKPQFTAPAPAPSGSVFIAPRNTSRWHNDAEDEPKPKLKSKNARPWEQLEVSETYSPKITEETALTPSDTEDIDDLRESFQIVRSDEQTLVFAIAIALKDDAMNALSAIKCNGGTTFGGYAYDRSRDSYIVTCCDFITIGRLPFSYVLTMKNLGGWKIKVPISETVLEKHLTPPQKKILADFRKKLPSPAFDIQLVQMLGCN